MVISPLTVNSFLPSILAFVPIFRNFDGYVLTNVLKVSVNCKLFILTVKAFKSNMSVSSLIYLASNSKVTKASLKVHQV